MKKDTKIGTQCHFNVGISFRI